MSDTNITAIAFQAESAWGVLPAPVSLKRFRTTKSGLVHDKMTVRSQEISPDRQNKEAVEVGVEAKGSLDFELSTDLVPFLEAALMSAFSGVDLINGATRKSFLIEEKFTDTAFMSFPGMMVDELSLKITSRQIITGAMTFLGISGDPATVTLDTGGTYQDPGNGPILSASANVGSLTEGGSAIASVKGIEFAIKNNLRANDVVGNKEMEAVGVGSCDLTGKIEAYFRDITLVQKFVNHTVSSLAFQVTRVPVGAVTGDLIGFAFEIPALRYTGEPPTIQGKDQDVMLSMPFSAEASTAVAASKLFTFTGQPTDTQTVTVGGKVYQFQTTLTNVANNVLIGVSTAASMANLIAAINGAAGSGTTYAAATLANSNVTALAGVGTTFTATAQVAGAAGNAIVIGETLTNGSWAGAAVLLSGGVDSYTIKITKLLQP